MKPYVFTSKVNNEKMKIPHFLLCSKKMLWFQCYIFIFFAAIFVNLPFFFFKIFLLTYTSHIAILSIVTKILI